MAIIQVQNLSFTYPGSFTPVFESLNFHMDTSWRLGLVGRNGRGKTTLLRLLTGELTGSGHITASVGFEYFPYAVDPELPALRCMRAAIAPFDSWEAQMQRLLDAGDAPSLMAWGDLEQRYAAAGGYQINELIFREADRMAVDPETLSRPLASFSPGQRTRLLLAALFLKKNQFLLIDEPTNHLDTEGRRVVAAYLKNKQGFILVSHDRWFLDATVDHILSLQKTGAWVEQGNYSTYREGKLLKDEFERQKNKKLAAEIDKLRETSREKRQWSDRIEAGKIGSHVADRGAVGHQAAKMMKKSLAIQKRTDRLIEEKEGLLQDLEYASALTLEPTPHPARVLMRLNQVSAGYDGRPVFQDLTLELAQGDKLALIGPNGAGKSTLIKLMTGELAPLQGQITRASNLAISLLPQSAGRLSGTPQQLARARGLDESWFLMLLRKLDFPREAFLRDMAGYSMGQKKKILLAASLSTRAHLYIWDEPLNYIDLESREQIENMLAESAATLVLVEHDQRFVERIATATLDLSRYA